MALEGMTRWNTWDDAMMAAGTYIRNGRGEVTCRVYKHQGKWHVEIERWRSWPDAWALTMGRRKSDEQG